MCNRSNDAGRDPVYLVSNTYHLTRENYFKEVAPRIETFPKRTRYLRFHEQVLSGILMLSAHYAARQIDKTLFLKKLRTLAIRSDERLLDETIAVLDRQQHRLYTSVKSVSESAMLEKNDNVFKPLIMPDFLRSYLLMIIPKPAGNLRRICGKHQLHSI
ncbi:hypothetical protein [Mucilaginibacter jinjuensis]|uniref:Uncharacterized protein n=1 Tax=Mucilaginibacter jinjuensis TaxID=1176721 RepID=A0ABY7TAQ4_9SPHI|nr:hypothetical protein [Mucilaginibacter jinjuensis]WCT13269.1 hypothetical protein PQO05_04905 [Mucilaginibacter jinjuensis]